MQDMIDHFNQLHRGKKARRRAMIQCMRSVGVRQLNIRR